MVRNDQHHGLAGDGWAQPTWLETRVPDSETLQLGWQVRQDISRQALRREKSALQINLNTPPHWTTISHILPDTNTSSFVVVLGSWLFLRVLVSQALVRVASTISHLIRLCVIEAKTKSHVSFALNFVSVAFWL